MEKKKVAKKRVRKTGKKIEFTCHSKEAQSVFLAGTFNDWQADSHPLKMNSSGDWTLELKLPPGRYEYKFVIDGEWACGPKCSGDHACPECVLNVHGTMNRVLEVK